MGLPSSKLCSPMYEPSQNKNYLSGVQPNFYKPTVGSDMLLSYFRGKLLPEECVYVLATLMNQYFQRIRNKKRVIVSDQLCRVTNFGEVLADSSHAIVTQGQYATNYLKVIDKIVQLVSNLCIIKESLWIDSIGRLKDYLFGCICEHHNNDQLLHCYLHKYLKKFIEKHQIRCNLGQALAREQQSKINYKKSQKKFHISDFHHTFGDLNQNSSVSLARFREELSITEEIAFKKKPSNFQKKSTYQRDSQNSSSKEILNFQNIYSCNVISCKRTNKSIKRNLNHKLYISPQYSLTIANFDANKENVKAKQSKGSSCIRKNRCLTQLIKSSCPPQNLQKQSIELQRNNTSINLRVSQRKRTSINGAKSVLQTMARLVQVRQEPSSKSIIY